MTKKDFELIADILRQHAVCRRSFPENNEICSLHKDFADKLAKTNPRFNRQRFLAACGEKE